MFALNRNVLAGVAAIAVVVLATVAMTKGPFSSDMAAWVQAFGAIIAIGAAAYLQDRDRSAQRRDAHHDRMKALRAIVNRCEFTLCNINKERGTLQSARKLRYWADETQADIRAIEGISLVEIGDDEALDQIIRLRGAVTTVRRNVHLALESMQGAEAVATPDIRSQLKQVTQIRTVAERLCGGVATTATAAAS